MRAAVAEAVVDDEATLLLDDDDDDDDESGANSDAVAAFEPLRAAAIVPGLGAAGGGPELAAGCRGAGGGNAGAMDGGEDDATRACILAA